MANTRLNILSVRALTTFALLVAGLGVAQKTEAQAYYTASKSLSLSAFGGVNYYQSDYGKDYNKNYTSFVVGSDATHELGSSYGVSLEPRYGHIAGPLDTEDYFLGNVKIEKAIPAGHWLHPYGIAGVGYGKIHEAKFTDNSMVTAFGGGLDLGVTEHIALKADWQYQFWNLGTPHTSFNPHGYTAALVYRFGGGSFPGSR